MLHNRGLKGRVPAPVETFEATQPPETALDLVRPAIQSSPMESLEQMERRHIAKVLEAVNQNKSRASAILGIDRVTLYRKCFRYGLISKSTRGRPRSIR